MATEQIEITTEQTEILKHTLKNGRFYTSAKAPDLVALCELGLMKVLSGGWSTRERYFGITDAGKELLEKEPPNNA